MLAGDEDEGTSGGDFRLSVPVLTSGGLFQDTVPMLNLGFYSNPVFHSAYAPGFQALSGCQ